MERHKKQRTDAQGRYEKVIEYLGAGVTNRTEIATNTGISRQAIQRYIKLWEQDTPVAEIRAVGREPKLTGRDRTHIAQIIARNPTETASSIKYQLADKRLVDVSAETIRRHVHEMDYKNSRPVFVPFLTRLHKERRLSWCIQHAEQNWKQVFCFVNTANR
jgi:transposase